MMKILIVSEVFYPEDFMVNEIACEWQRMGHRVEVITQYPSYPQSYVYDNYSNKGRMIENWYIEGSDEPIKIHRFPFIEGYKNKKYNKFSNYLYFVRGGRQIIKTIAKEFDVIFVSQTGPLTVALPALSARRSWGIPVAILTLDLWPDVVWMYGIPKNPTTGWVLDKLIKYVYTHCDKIFVSSKRFESTISKYTDAECIYTPNWLRETKEVESSLRMESDAFHFTFTGNVSRYQNLINTIAGFAKAGINDAVLNIVGAGSYLDDILSYVERNQIQNIKFRGRFPYNEMSDIMKQSDVLVLPLIANEGIMKTEPLKLQSYLAAGKPILGILGGSAQDIIEEYNLGLCAKPDDVDDIARGFREIYNYAKNNSDGVALRAQSLMATRFNKDIIMDTLTKGLGELVNNRETRL